MRGIRRLSNCSSAIAISLSAFAAQANVEQNSLFADNAVLQMGMSVPIWGTADPGERVAVEFAGQTVTTTATSDGKWLVSLAAMKAGGPYTLAISAKNKIVLSNILVGEVWICSGQSNMERQLGLRSGQKPITNFAEEVATAQYPEIRHFGGAQARAFLPTPSVKGNWAVCSPKTVPDFSAVGYFFARDLYKARHVPIGLIHVAWGGTPAEAWMSQSALGKVPDFAEPLAEVKRLAQDPASAMKRIEAQLEQWYGAKDPGTSSKPPWNDPKLDTTSWKTMALPTQWEQAGYENFDGTFWFRRTVVLAEDPTGSEAELHLGAIDDNDTTWVNGHRVGATLGWNVPRKYRIPANVLKRGANVIAVRVLDTAAGGGIWGGGDALALMIAAKGKTRTISLAGPWSYQPGASLKSIGRPPMDYSQSPGAPSVLYNGMIAPLLPYAIRGVIWYQGEANVGRERQYRTLFPSLISDWRGAFGQAELPFLFVQIAPYQWMTPEIREAQLFAWQNTNHTAMVVTTDCGDADDIHPAHKQPVGGRLALAARALAYGEKLEYSGPAFESMKLIGNTAVLRFTHSQSGLIAKGGKLKGFSIAGADKIFHAARAEVQGQSVVVSSPDVTQPTAVRYGWANVPEGNLFNRADLPASPFRTDVE